MGILQTTHGIVRNINTQILLVQAVPCSRHILNFQSAANQLLFQFVADHDVICIGEFISGGTNQRRLCLVDCAVEHLFIHIRKLLGEQFFDLGENCMNECTASADDVLIEPALALMDAHGNTTLQSGKIILIVRTQLIERMTAFVNDGIHGICQVILVVMGRDAHVLVVKVCCKRMLCFRNAAVITVHAQHIHQIIRKFTLCFHRIMTVQEAVINLRNLLNPVNQRHQLLPQFSKEFVQHCRAHTLFVLIQQRIVRFHLRIVVSCKFAVICHNLLKIGRKQIEVIFILCLFPNGLCVIEQNRVCDALLRRNPLGFIVGFAQHFDLTFLHAVQFIQVCFQIGKHPAYFRGGFQIICNFGKLCHGLTTALPCTLGRCGCGIQIYDTDCVIVGSKCQLVIIQRFQRLSDSFIFHHDSHSLRCYKISISFI